jgi:hypothetical protein
MPLFIPAQAYPCVCFSFDNIHIFADYGISVCKEAHALSTL